MGRRLYYSYFLLVIISFLAGSQVLLAQSNRKIDSLKASLPHNHNTEQQAGIIRAIANEYAVSRQNDSAIVYAKMSIPLFQSLKQEDLLGRANFFVGNLYLNRNDYQAAMPHLLAAEAYYTRTEDHERTAMLHYSLGAISLYHNDPDKAISYYLKNIALYKAGKKVDKVYLTNTYLNLYRAYFQRQEYGLALNTANEYIDFAGKNDPGQLASGYQLLGGLYRVTFENRKSIAALQKSIALLEKQGNRYQIAYSGFEIGNNYLALKKNDSARMYMERALQYYRSVDSVDDISRTLNSLSAVAFEDKDYDLAEKYILDAIKLSDENNQGFIYHNSFLWTIRLSKLMEDSAALKQPGRNRTALENVTRELTKNMTAIQSRNDYISPNLIIHNYDILSEANSQLGNYELALSYLKKKIAWKDSIYGIERMVNLSNKGAELELAKEKSRITLEEETKRLQLQKEIALEALRYEYERKQALARTAEEKKRLLLQEALKRQEIGLKYEQEQKAITLKYEQEQKIQRIEQEKKDAIAAAELSRSRNIRNMSAIGVCLALLLLGITAWSYFQKRKDNRRIALEKQKSDELLLNILPYEIAEELKQKGETAARHHEEVSVLFTDFVNFTASSEKVGVQELLNELNICFTAFDNIMVKHGLEKIKTIGDAYLAVSGLPLANARHAQQAVHAALDIASFIKERKESHPDALDIRIGIHSGPVIAGIVGVKKFAYDIWGDTVNTAARMEQNGEKGKVNLSAATYQLIKNDFECIHRGKIHTKGKGDLDMYFVQG